MDPHSEVVRSYWRFALVLGPEDEDRYERMCIFLSEDENARTGSPLIVRRAHRTATWSRSEADYADAVFYAAFPPVREPR